MDTQNFINKLTKAIEQTVKENAMPQQTEPAPSKSDRLKLEVQAYLQSSDIFDKVRIKGEICSHTKSDSMAQSQTTRG